MNKNILITICARGGSKGIPGKNIKILAGRPLIYYSLNVASKFKKLFDGADIVLSTDDLQIKDQVAELEFNVDMDYIRPSFLASDTAGKIDAIRDVLKYSEAKNNIHYDFILDLDVTSPLRTVQDIITAYNILREKPEAYNIFSVSPANRNPYFNMVEENDKGFFSLCKSGVYKTRQSTPKVYDMNASFYIYRDKFFKDGLKTAITEKSLIYEVPHVCFDLDHHLDFQIMSYLLESQLLDFEI